MPKPEITEDQNLRIRDHMVEGLRNSFERGLGRLPDNVRNVIKTDAWQKRYVERLGKVAGFSTFEAFVEAEPLDGLGGSLDQLKRACAHRKDVIEAIGNVTTGSKGGQPNNKNNAKGVNQYTIEDEVGRTNRDSITVRPPAQPELEETKPKGKAGDGRGDSVTYALRRLRDLRPDLHQKVLAEELKPHTAMVQAGLRPRTGTFYPEDINRTARTLAKHFDPDELYKAMTEARNG